MTSVHFAHSRLLHTMLRVASLERAIAFVKDPDGYRVELIQRDGAMTTP